MSAPATRPRQHQHRLSPAEVADLIADYQSGMSVAAVAKKHHVCLVTAARWLTTNGITIRPNKGGIPRNQLASAAALRNRGWSWAKIGQYYGCSHAAARTAVLRFVQVAAEGPAAP